MNSYRTIEEARNAAATKESIAYILEIAPGVAGVEKYIICKVNDTELRKDLKYRPMREIKAVVGIAADLVAERIAAKKELLKKMVPGLDELRAALNDRDRHYRATQSRFDDENGCCRQVRPVAVDPEQAAEKYPVAAAYIKADGWTNSNNVGKYSAGKKAKARIEAGENHEIVIADMEREWTSYATKNVD